VAVVRLDDLDVVAGGQALAASSSSLSVTLTPTLMLGASTMGCCAAAGISAFCASEKPVVPITMATPCWRQAARCASVPRGG
jgi:hypothetical protein